MILLLKLHHSLEVVLQFLSVIEVNHYLLDQEESIHIIDVEYFHEGTFACQTVSPQQKKASFKEEK